jgi:transketolase
VHAEETGGRPGMVWVKTRKGRGYYKFDAASHGAAHKRNSDLFWKGREDFQQKYGVRFAGFGDTSDPGETAGREQARAWFTTVFSVLEHDRELCEYLADTLVELGDSVPREIPSVWLDSQRNMAEDRSWLSLDRLPEGLFVKPGTSVANKNAFATFGAWLNSLANERMGRPLVLACSADLAESTGIAGFCKDFEGHKNFGWYERTKNPHGSLLPQQITEFTNSGLAAGIATVNMSAEPEKEFLGYWAGCSTYGSFSYLKYGLMRLFSQLAQDSPLRVGKVLWVVGHSGPETAEDSRTHFGIFAPGVTQLFPDGHVINLHPWEHNEVAPMLAAALLTDRPIIAIHLTRPNVKVPDRAALGIPSHFAAARGAYVIRAHDPARPKEGTVIVHGTSTTDSVYSFLSKLASPDGPNIKLVQATSWELFQLEPQSYRDAVLPWDDWMDSTVITNGARRLMHDWLPHKVAEQYAMSSDWDDRWRTGGNVEELKKEAHIDPDSLWAGILRFAKERPERARKIGVWPR